MSGTEQRSGLPQQEPVNHDAISPQEAQQPKKRLLYRIRETLKDYPYGSVGFRAFLDQSELQDNKLSEYYPDYAVESSRTQRKKTEVNIKAWKRKSTLYKGVSENIEGMIEEERTELEEQLKAFRKQAPHSVFLAAASDEYLVQSVLS